MSDMQKIKSIKGGVCSAKGFRAAGVAAEIKYKGRNDVALIVADEPCAASIFLTSLRASKIRITSIPLLIDFLTNSSTTSSA